MRICNVSLVCFLVFLTLKLSGVVEWNWGYILLPIAAWLGGILREGEIEKHLDKDLSNV